ncbi:MAG: hypothetical protein HRU19_28825 [Pseudobacteriovorax sp.]|nr:hypothetical protein [Pseudobacteriovorax sp.]
MKQLEQTSCPKGMEEHVISKRFPVSDEQSNAIWHNLNLRETFVDGQIFPYRVEFDAKSQNGPFAEGELNIHHGPGLSAHGRIGKITSEYRILQYFYGSYVLSFRWIRPVSLEFYRHSGAIELKLRCYVRPWMKPIWQWGNDLFWKYFGISFLWKHKDGEKRELAS